MKCISLGNGEGAAPAQKRAKRVDRLFRQDWSLYSSARVSAVEHATLLVGLVNATLLVGLATAQILVHKPSVLGCVGLNIRAFPARTISRGHGIAAVCIILFATLAHALGTGVLGLMLSIFRLVRRTKGLDTTLSYACHREFFRSIPGYTATARALFFVAPGATPLTREL